jgi:propanol-preferring alcohol dehydrogenase
MRAMVCAAPRTRLALCDVADPVPGPSQVLVRVRACGVCRTDLHVVDGELSDARWPIIPGHEIVGTVESVGNEVTGVIPGQRIGVPWLGRTCGGCPYCRTARENLCDFAQFTGYTIDGGYAELAVADAHFCFPLPGGVGDVDIAPWLCAGLIGYRALRMAGDHARRIGIYGFGAAAHIVAQLARFEGREIAAFTRGGDAAAQDFARELGASWAGGSDDPAPFPLDAALIFAPVGALVPVALRAVVKGGTVVCAGIHMSDVPSFPYAILWGERRVVSVANLTRRDGEDFFQLAAKAGVRTRTTAFALDRANDALDALRSGKLTGAAVLTP